MARELAFVLINPYTISKSRTGGVIARYVGRTDLEFVGARMIGPNEELVKQYAALVRKSEPDSRIAGMIARYIEEAYAPNPDSGRPRRVLLLLFEGEDAVHKIWEITGSATTNSASGQTIRDTYGDFVLNESGDVQYFEPAVLTAPNVRRAGMTLKLWSRYTSECGGIVASAMDVPEGDEVEQTLVMLKPDNFRVPSLRAGNIIDILSRSGLRIVAAKKFSMTVPEAEEFYGPVREALAAKFEDIGAARAAAVLSREFEIDIVPEEMKGLCRELGPKFAQTQFESIVQFMTGCGYADYRKHVAASKNVAGRLRGFWARMTGTETSTPGTGGREGCLALVYEGVNAVKTIRDILGPTDPSKAEPGSVRREFGSNIMVNAAHASDSPDNARREMKIIKVDEDKIKTLVEKYYGR